MTDELKQRDLLTAGEAAKFLHITPDRLRYLRNQGRVPFTLQIGNETFYSMDNLRKADIEVRKRGRKRTGKNSA